MLQQSGLSLLYLPVLKLSCLGAYNQEADCRPRELSTFKAGGRQEGRTPSWSKRALKTPAIVCSASDFKVEKSSVNEDIFTDASCRKSVVVKSIQEG